jgi:hypothetical protein
VFFHGFSSFLLMFQVEMQAMKVGELGEERHKDSGGAFYEPSLFVGSILCFLWSLVMSSGIDKVTSLCVVFWSLVRTNSFK